MSESAVDQHPSALTHSSSPPSTPLSAKGIGLAGEPTHLQTRPPDLVSPFILFHASRSPNPSSHTFTFSPHALSLCVSTEDRGQAAKQAGGLVCGTVLISTGVLRRKATLSTTTNPLPQTSSSLSLFLSPRLWRLVPSSRLHRQVCEGCRCQLSFSWTAANLSPYRPCVVISLFIPISLFFPPPAVYLLMNSVSRARFCFPALFRGEYVFLFFRRGQVVMDPHWHSGTKVGQGRERPGRRTVCVHHTMPGLQSVSCVLSA